VALEPKHRSQKHAILRHFPFLLKNPAGKVDGIVELCSVGYALTYNHETIELFTKIDMHPLCSVEA